MKINVFRVTLVAIVSLLAFFLGLYVGGPRGVNVHSAAELVGLEFTPAQIDSMKDGLNDQRSDYRNIRTVTVANSVQPAIRFSPLPEGFRVPTGKNSISLSPGEVPARPADLNDLAFASVRQLGEMIRTRRITSVELTKMYLDRLKKYGPALECIITLTEDRAMAQARRLDDELARGRYRGPLHGIPYGLKDLFSTKGTKTTWGSVPYKDQVIDEDATVVRKLEEAGAILIVKTTVGELAWGDVWFGGMTRNPWNAAQGSSGSSAGSAASTSAGLVGFAIGTETWGSIVSPSTRCGVTGLRPTFGRVSRSGAMALSWSMDKAGAICRTVEDCAIVLNAIAGPDGKDECVVDAQFSYKPDVNLRSLRIGYLKMEFDSTKDDRANNDSVLTVLRSLGAQLIPISLPSKYPTSHLSIILSAESGAAFDELTRSHRDDLMVRQIKDAWPNSFRLSRFIPAVEYIQANRIRTLLMNDMQSLMDSIDVYVAPTFEGDNLLLTNLTGHPCVVVPDGFSSGGTPTSITFTGRLFDEGTLLAVAKKYQDATAHHLRHPDMEKFLKEKAALK